MRLSEIPDYFRLRPYLRDAPAFLRLRKKGFPGPFVDVPFRDGSSARIRNVPMDRHIFLHIFARDDYHLNGLPPGSLATVIDVGAHIGLFAIRVAPLATRVLCFEPSPVNFELLQRNVAGLPAVSTSCRAVAGSRGPAVLHLSDNPAGHSLYPAAGEAGGARVAVEGVTLEDIFAEHRVDRCGLLKLDCEGAEYAIVHGAPRSLWDKIDRVAMEYHPVATAPPGWTVDALARRLEEMGHDVKIEPARKVPSKGHLFTRRRGLSASRGP